MSRPGDSHPVSNYISVPQAPQVKGLPQFQEAELNEDVPFERTSPGGEGDEPGKPEDSSEGADRYAIEAPDSVQSRAHDFAGPHRIAADAPQEIPVSAGTGLTLPSDSDSDPQEIKFEDGEADAKPSLRSLRTEVLPRRRSESWESKVYELSQRAVSLENLLEFYLRLGQENGPMPQFDPLRSTTNDVVRGAIIPESRDGCCALASVFSNGQPQMPQKMVTHHWANRFSHTLAAIVADALDLPTYQSIALRLADRASCEQLKEELREKGKLSLLYWLCAVSVNQHGAICGGCAPGHIERDSVTRCAISFCRCSLPKHFFGDECEMNKFNEMMALLCRLVPSFGQVVVVDECFEIFSRAWCIAELVEAHQKNMSQHLKIHSVASLKSQSKMLKCLDVRDCRASRAEDKDAILAGIEDVDAFNGKLHELLMGRHDGLLVNAYQLLAGYTLWWDGFSNDYLHQLSQREHHIVPLCTLVALPMLIGLVFMIFPLRPPGEDWQNQSLFFYVYLPLGDFTCILYFPFWVQQFTGMELNKAVCVRMLLWVACDATAQAIAVLCCAAVVDIFPVPWSLVIGAIVNGGVQPLMWFCAPAHQRRDSKFKRRFDMAQRSSGALLFIFGMLFPFLNLAIKKASTIWQMALILVFLACKLLFEHLGRLLARRTSADTMINFIFMGTYCYEINLCIMFCGGFDWMVFVELVAFDTIENLFHLWSLARDRRRSLQERSSNLQEHSGTQTYIVSVLVVREFSEVLIPAQFLAVLSLARLIQPRFLDVICDMSDSQLRRAQLFLFADVCIELVLASITRFVLKYYGFRPLHLLCSVVSKEFVIMVTFASCALAYFLCLHHSHLGMNLTFTFPWLQSDHATWHCGLNWHV